MDDPIARPGSDGLDTTPASSFKPVDDAKPMARPGSDGLDTTPASSFKPVDDANPIARPGSDGLDTTPVGQSRTLPLAGSSMFSRDKDERADSTESIEQALHSAKLSI